MFGNTRRSENIIRHSLRVRPAGVLLCFVLSLLACSSHKVNFEDEVILALQKVIKNLEDAGEDSNGVFADGALDQHSLGFDQAMQAAQSELTMLLQRDPLQQQINCQILEKDRLIGEGCRLITDASLRLSEMRLYGTEIFHHLGWNNLKAASRDMARCDAAASAARRKLLAALDFYLSHMQAHIARGSEQVLRLAIAVILVLTTLVAFCVRLILQNRQHQSQLMEKDRASREYTRRLELIGREVRRLRDLGSAIDATAGVLIFNQHHRVEMVNENFRLMRLLGKANVKGFSIVDILGVEDDEPVDDIVAAVASKDIWRGEIHGRCEDGTPVWMYALFYPELDDLEDFEGSLALILDITASKKVQMTLDRTRHLTSLGEMAAGIAHEINNPLSVINGRVNVLLKKMQNQAIDAAMFQSGLEQIQRTVTRIARIVDSMRRLSRSDATAADARPEKIDTIVREALEFIDDKLKKQGVQFSIHDPLALSEARVLLQGFGLSQIIINLLSNAVDAIESVPEGERWVRLELSLNTARKLEMRIVDPGHGIPPSIRERIMQPFFTTKPAGKGTGLGLSLSQRIAEEHGGRIYYDEDAANTTFVLELPEWQKNRDAA